MPTPEIMPGVSVDTAMELQAGLDLLNEKDPPTFHVPHFLANPRHECQAARQSELTGKGISTATDTKEVYATGWDGVTPTYDPEGETAILFRQGKCKKCKAVVRSEVGKVVLTAERQRLSGRVGR